MKYEDNTNYEINKAVANYFHPELDKCCLPDISDDVVMLVKPASGGCAAELMYSVDYCNNPQDSWHIFNEAYIEIKRDSCQAHVSSYFNPSFVVSCLNTEKDILRAAMVCFLVWKGE